MHSSKTNSLKPEEENKTISQSSKSEIASFLAQTRKANPNKAGRLVFALDATMSRQPTWDRAMNLQASMFDAVDEAGSNSSCLFVQLVYFRGYGECRASKFVMQSSALRDLMTGIECRGGKTQIGKVLSHVHKTGQEKKVDALIFVGDAMEENIDAICDKAGKLGLMGTRCFMFLEGNDPNAALAFKQIARLTNGAFFALGPNSSRQLAELLAAVAVYANGGLKALKSDPTPGNRKLLKQFT